MGNLVNEVYEEMIGTILQGFSEDEYGEVKTSYKEYLEKYYGDKKHEDMTKLKDAIVSMEQMKWEGETKKSKQVSLFSDAYLERLGYLSNLALKYAMMRLQGSESEIIPVEKAEEYIALMKEYAGFVRDFNKEIAMIYLSEGILDYQYAVGLSDNMSFRLNS